MGNSSIYYDIPLSLLEFDQHSTLPASTPTMMPQFQQEVVIEETTLLLYHQQRSQRNLDKSHSVPVVPPALLTPTFTLNLSLSGAGLLLAFPQSDPYIISQFGHAVSWCFWSLGSKCSLFPLSSLPLLQHPTSFHGPVHSGPFQVPLAEISPIFTISLLHHT